MTRRYRGISIITGPKDIPPDVVPTAIMAWMMDTYSMTVGYSCPGVVTGKPIEVGGFGRREATGRGVFYVTRELPPQGFDRARPRRHQGFGNRLQRREIFSEHGSKVVGISDVGGDLYDAKGLDLHDIMATARRANRSPDNPEGRAHRHRSGRDSLGDILIPAAMEHHEGQRGQDQGQYVIEGANGSTSATLSKSSTRAASPWSLTSLQRRRRDGFLLEWVQTCSPTSGARRRSTRARRTSSSALHRGL